MKKIILFGHYSCENHGCEALVRTSAEFIKKNLSGDITLITGSPEKDRRYINDTVKLQKVGGSVKAISMQRVAAKLCKTFFNSMYFYDRSEMRAVFEQRNALCFAIGGDNYCYADYGRYNRMNSYLTKHKNKTILWGCSIEPDLLRNKKLVKDLNKYSLITARETITLKALESAGIENCIYCPDTAFMLPAEKTELPEIFSEHDVVGINISPLISKYADSGDIIRENYIALLRYIINETDMNIALIPHVISEYSDDLVPLSELYEQFKETGRVALIDKEKKLNACQLKFIISNCRFLVAARTHASIAAYSSGVPALVAGYSVKAKGIAKDIFGSYEDYVCPVQQLQNKESLQEQFVFIQKNEQEIKKALCEFNSKISSYMENCVGEIKALL